MIMSTVPQSILDKHINNVTLSNVLTLNLSPGQKIFVMCGSVLFASAMFLAGSVGAEAGLNDDMEVVTWMCVPPYLLST
jgi:hypothetical protein